MSSRRDRAEELLDLMRQNQVVAFKARSVSYRGMASRGVTPSFLFRIHRLSPFAVGSGFGGGGGGGNLRPPAARGVGAISDLAAEIDQLLHQGRVGRGACAGQVVLNCTTEKTASRLAETGREFIDDCCVGRRNSKREVAANPGLSW